MWRTIDKGFPFGKLNSVRSCFWVSPKGSARRRAKGDLIWLSEAGDAAHG